MERGERVGMIKFGSRVDVLLHASASLQVKAGDRVKGGATVLALLPVEVEMVSAGRGQAKQGAQ